MTTIKFPVKIRTAGHSSYIVTIPKEVMEALQLKVGDMLQCEAEKIGDKGPVVLRLVYAARVLACG